MCSEIEKPRRMNAGKYIFKHRLIPKIIEYNELQKSKKGRNTKRYCELKKEILQFYLDYTKTPCDFCRGESKTCKSWCYKYKIWKTGKNINARKGF